MARRTTLRSSKGKKLYAVRNADGTFEDIQTYKRAHGSDVRKRSGAETTTRRKKAAKKGVITRKKNARKAAAKKSSRKSSRKKSRR